MSLKSAKINLDPENRIETLVWKGILVYFIPLARYFPILFLPAL